MITLKKTPDKDNKFDISTVEVSIDHSHIGAEDLKLLFKEFMLALGYHPNTVDKVFGDEE